MAVQLYRALETCYVGDVLRNPGDHFTWEFDEGKVPDYVEEMTDPAAPIDSRQRERDRARERENQRASDREIEREMTDTRQRPPNPGTEPPLARRRPADDDHDAEHRDKASGRQHDEHHGRSRQVDEPKRADTALGKVNEEPKRGDPPLGKIK